MKHGQNKHEKVDDYKEVKKNEKKIKKEEKKQNKKIKKKNKKHRKLKLFLKIIAVLILKSRQRYLRNIIKTIFYLILERILYIPKAEWQIHSAF